MKVRVLRFKDFPQRLKEIPEPPEKLQYIGELPDFEKYRFLTIVGSRAPSKYTEQVLEKLISGLEGYPIVIVSGLAIGSDALAHKFALKYKLKTIAVPGSGLSKKVLYPKTNYTLALNILNSGGALLSEFEFEQAAAPWTFPQRNRIMAALADAVLVVQAKEKSGTSITARLALEYNKNVLTIPADIFSENFKGNIKLLKEGAFPVSEPLDILNALNLQEVKYKKQEELNLELSENEEKILQSLDEAKEKELLLQESGLSAQDFAIALAKLEIRGFISERLGKIYKNL